MKRKGKAKIILPHLSKKENAAGKGDSRKRTSGEAPQRSSPPSRKRTGNILPSEREGVISKRRRTVQLAGILEA